MGEQNKTIIESTSRKEKIQNNILPEKLVLFCIVNHMDPNETLDSDWVINLSGCVLMSPDSFDDNNDDYDSQDSE